MAGNLKTLGKIEKRFAAMSKQGAAALRDTFGKVSSIDYQHGSYIAGQLESLEGASRALALETLQKPAADELAENMDEKG